MVALTLRTAAWALAFGAGEPAGGRAIWVLTCLVSVPLAVVTLGIRTRQVGRAAGRFAGAAAGT